MLHRVHLCQRALLYNILHILAHHHCSFLSWLTPHPPLKQGRYLFLNALANQLRYPNSHTHYFSCVLLFLFSEAQQVSARVCLSTFVCLSTYSDSSGCSALVFSEPQGR
jgi:CCR4-Not complex component, Not1